MRVCLTYRIEGIYDGFAADRSLAELVSCYRDFARRKTLKPGQWELVAECCTPVAVDE